MGHVRPGVQASQTEIGPSPWIFWAYPPKGCKRSFLPGHEVLEGRVSGHDDDVRRFLRDCRSTFQVGPQHSLYFPPHWCAKVWTEKCDGQRQVVWRFQVNGGQAMQKLMLAGMRQPPTEFFHVAPSSAAVQNELHSAVILPIKARTICAPQKS